MEMSDFDVPQPNSWKDANEIGVAKGSPHSTAEGLTIVDSDTGDSVWVPQRCVAPLIDAIRDCAAESDYWPIRIPR